MSTTASGTKDLKQVMSFMDLMAMAVGQIIGSGVMVMSISALAMTGRSVNIAFMIAAVMTIMAAVPYMFVASTVRLRGGYYTQRAVLVNPWFAGFAQFVSIFSSVSQSMFAIGMVSYLCYVFPALSDYQVIAAVVLMLVFYILNFFGTEWMAKAQTIMFYLLIAALALFVVFGVPKVAWGQYFGNELFGRPLIENGFTPLMQASAYLTFATGGATVVVNYSADAKNPTKDIPIVIIVSTVLVAIVYFFLASCIGGIMHPDTVIAAGNLAPIAELIMPKVCYWFFMIAGAGFALGTTLNSSIANAIRPFLQACSDGWFPRGLAILHPKFNSPYRLLILFGIVNTAPIILGWSVSQIGQMTLFIGNILAFVLFFGTTRLPKVFPEQWEKSAFHVSDTALKLWMLPCCILQAYQAYLNGSGAGMRIVLLNVAVFIVSAVYATLMLKSGKVTMEVSYTND